MLNGNSKSQSVAKNTKKKQFSSMGHIATSIVIFITEECQSFRGHALQMCEIVKHIPDL